MGLGASSFESMSVDQGIRAIAEHLVTFNMQPHDAFKWLDSDNNGWLSWQEFLQTVNRRCIAVNARPVHELTLYQIFKRFDRDNNDFIAMQEFTDAIGRDRLQTNLAQNVLERIASSLVRTGFGPADLFQRLDKDRNGALNRLELEEVCLSLQPDLTQAEREAIFLKLDSDQSGFVDVNEFCNALNGVNAGPLVALEEKVRSLKRTFSDNGWGYWESFNAFDVNGDGFLSKQEWQGAMASIMPNMLIPDVDAIFFRFDGNGDGYLSLQEFMEFFTDLTDRSCNNIQPGQWPTYQAPPTEERWQKEVLDIVKECLSVGRSGLSITEVFRRLDLDGDNKMTAYEFDRLITTYRPELQRDHLIELFQKVNTSQSGAINMNEFIARLG